MCRFCHGEKGKKVNSLHDNYYYAISFFASFFSKLPRFILIASKMINRFCP